MITRRTTQQILNKNCTQRNVQLFLPTQKYCTTSNSKEFAPVYKFSHIKSLAVINKAKLYQTIATCIGLPSCYALSATNLCSQEVFAGVATIGVTGCLIFHTLGFMVSNTVGIIYLHKDNLTTKISYLDTWGSRRDTIIDLKDIVPFGDQPMSITDPLYLKLQKYSSKDQLKLNVKYGVVLDAEKFAKIFHRT